MSPQEEPHREGPRLAFGQPVASSHGLSLQGPSRRSVVVGLPIRTSRGLLRSCLVPDAVDPPALSHDVGVGLWDPVAKDVTAAHNRRRRGTGADRRAPNSSGEWRRTTARPLYRSSCSARAVV